MIQLHDEVRISKDGYIDWFLKQTPDETRERVEAAVNHAEPASGWWQVVGFNQGFPMLRGALGQLNQVPFECVIESRSHVKPADAERG